MSEKQSGIQYWLEHWMKNTDYEDRVEYWMKHPGYEILAGEPREVTDEIIRRLLLKPGYEIPADEDENSNE